jgi:hypothetical protein
MEPFVRVLGEEWLAIGRRMTFGPEWDGPTCILKRCARKVLVELCSTLITQKLMATMQQWLQSLAVT